MHQVIFRTLLTRFSFWRRSCGYIWKKSARNNFSGHTHKAYVKLMCLLIWNFVSWQNVLKCKCLDLRALSLASASSEPQVRSAGAAVTERNAQIKRKGSWRFPFAELSSVKCTISGKQLTLFCFHTANMTIIFSWFLDFLKCLRNIKLKPQYIDIACMFNVLHWSPLQGKLVVVSMMLIPRYEIFILNVLYNCLSVY